MPGAGHNIGGNPKPLRLLAQIEVVNEQQGRQILEWLRPCVGQNELLNRRQVED